MMYKNKLGRTFFGFAIADGMFADDNCVIVRTPITPEGAKELIDADVIPCLNPSHKATIDAMRQRFGIDVSIPKEPPKVTLKPYDRLIVMSVRGLPRLTDRHEYTTEEISSAEFKFACYDRWDDDALRALHEY